MRLLFVVQRYGLEVAGGAERAARDVAERMVGRGHHVEVVTSCALNYVDWANHYPAGSSELNGVLVHRLSVPDPRDDRLFGPLNARVVHGDPPLPLYIQEAWMRAQGPYLPDLPGWLWERAQGFDAVLFFTYLYWPIYAGLPAVAGRVPTVLMPFAHDEPYLKLPLFDTMFRLPDALGFLTEEEQALVQRRFRLARPTAVTGLGVDPAPAAASVASVRSALGLGDRPYLLALGRVDPAKGLHELFDFFAAYKARRPSDLALVVMGDPVRPLPEHPDVFPTGYVDEDVKHGALAGSVALVHPSYFESFSIVLTEAWAQGRPALVQGHCEVLEGQARRSGGAVPYYDYAGFEASVDLLSSDPELASALGRAGRRYLEQRYRWDAVIDRFERLLRLVVPDATLTFR
ncbi:MAG TPA: glycosyltransferase family 4 protein [Acidimicrobiales bacterium]|jgi:glycosyltransferase involved in cell wall biosynthesis|nr:glycosyltransferase family 4 protein [Acidimicrobiales bacterium]